MPAKDAELSDELLTLPSLPTLPSPGAPLAETSQPQPSNGLTAEQVTILLRLALDGLSEAAEAGSQSRAAALSLQSGGARDLLPAISAAIVSRAQSAGAREHEGPLDGAGLQPFLYDEAVAAVAAGRIETAVAALGALLHWRASEADALLGLAVCAVRLERYEQALILARDRMRLDADHPRALCIVGLCELRRGDRAAAQNYLAAATRLARRNPAFREELRAAQRLLIMMHFDR